MPRPSKGAYLWLRPARYKDRKLHERSTWIIRDGTKFISTGCAPEEAAAAEKRLADYIAEKHRPDRHLRDIELIDIADVLAVYDEDTRERQANKKKHDERMMRLAQW